MFLNKGRYMLGPVKLTGEQKKVLFLPPKNPIQIRGVAGSGKTTVALYRAKHLLDQIGDLFRKNRVAIFTFNKALSAYIKATMPTIGEPDGENDDGAYIEVTHFHKWAWHFLDREETPNLNRTVSGPSQIGIIARAIRTIECTDSNKRLLSRPKEFFQEEISWIKGKMIASRDEYLNTARSGRGNDGIKLKDKNVLWDVFEAYQKIMATLRHLDFDDYALLILKKIGDSSNFEPPFTHIIVDEAQDLSKAQLTVISRLVSKTTNSISIIADMAQQIYKRGFSWKDVGINLRGAPYIEFKKNYRNTEAIAKAAIALLQHDPNINRYSTIETHTTVGPKPLLKAFDNKEQENTFIADAVENKKIVNAGVTICVLHRTQQGVRDIQRCFRERGVEVESIIAENSVNFDSDVVKVSTMSSIKGLEFDYVFISGLSSDLIPLAIGYSQEDDLHISTERRLLYTCMTRARKELVLTYSGQPSQFLAEIPKNLMNI